jgi:hypothetical protein
MNGNTAHNFARGFIIFAGSFWLTLAITSGVWFFIFFALFFPMLMFYLSYIKPKVASLLLGLGALLPAVYGFMIHWQIGVWGIMSSFFFIPTILSAYLLYPSRRRD